MSMLLPRNYLQAETKIILLEHLKLSQNLLWDKFIEIEHYYKSQHYSYLFVSYDDKAIYKEYCNGTLINELEFDTHSTEWNVLQKPMRKSFHSLNWPKNAISRKRVSFPL